LDTQKRYSAANQILGVILARKGDLVQAAEYLRTYIKLVPKAAGIADVKKLLADLDRP
jgi:hypothetical protein